MTEYLLIHLTSITYANQAKYLLAKEKIYVKIQKTPASVSKTGCGFCLRVSPEDFENTIKILLDNKFQIQGAYEINKNNEIKRVSY